MSGCPGPDSHRAATKVINSCADDDLRSKSVLYFGPSNQIGPGSIWARLGGDGGYQPQWRTSDIGLDPSKSVQLGQLFQCDLKNNSKLSASVSLAVLSDAAKASGEVRSDFERAKNINVSVVGAAWDNVVLGPFTQQLNSLPDGAVKQDVFGNNRLFLLRALRLKGYKATLDFESSIKPALKAKYDGRLLGSESVGSVGAELSAKWTSDDKLELSAPGEIYVAGQFGELIKGNYVSTRDGSEGVQDLGDKTIRPYDK